MTKCHYCKRLIKELPFKCSFCGKYYCPEHRLPEKHKCRGLKEYKKQRHEKSEKHRRSWDYIGGKIDGIRKKEEDEQVKVIAKKKTILRRITNFIKYKLLPKSIQNWMRRSPKYLIQNIAFLTIYGLIALMIYQNIETINTIINIPLIKLGSLLLFIITFLFIKRIYWTLKSIEYLYNKQITTNQRIILLTALVILTAYIYNNQETYRPLIAGYNTSIEYEKFNPLIINISEIGEKVSGLTAGEPENMNKDTYNIELLVFRETNKIRRNHGQRELIWDPLLVDIARQHSLEMVKNKYFSHFNIEGEGPTERAEERGYETITRKGYVYQVGIGENIGIMPKGNVEGYGK